MYIIGEKLNSSIPKTLAAMNAGDEEELRRLVRVQAEAGADCIDINTALLAPAEEERLVSLAQLVCSELDGLDLCDEEGEERTVDLMLDSPDPAVLISALGKVKAFCGERKILINSVNDSEKYDALLPAIAEAGAKAVMMPMDGERIPESAEQRLAAAEKTAAKLNAAGIPNENILIDVLVTSLATSEENGAVVLFDTLRALKSSPALKGTKTTCGLSNISFGLPRRAVINSAFLSMAAVLGLDSAIVDPSSPALSDAIAASAALLGEDEYCMKYISLARERMK